MKMAVIYARYSSEKQNEQSIEGQLAVCRKYAEANDLTIVDTYIDRATTGTNDQRAAFQQMLADCDKPQPWSIVLVYAIDRFGRNSIEIAVNKQRLKKNRKMLISATQRTSENIDGTKNLDGILLENVYIGIAEYYSAELSQKVTRGMAENRKKGLFCGGQVTFGYRVENKRVVVDEDKAEIVRYIFKSYAEGRVAREIIQELTRRGVYSYGKPFPMNTFYNILRREKYIGISRHGDEVYTNIYPPIVPKPLFDEVQRILAKNQLGSRSNKMEFLLKGKCVCGYCGKHLQGESGTARDRTTRYYYKCAGRKKLKNCNKTVLLKEPFEKLVTDVTMQTFQNSELISNIADAVLQVHAKRLHDRSLLNILTQERDALQRSLNNMLKAIEEGVLTKTTKSRIEELELKLAETEDKISIEQYSMQNQITREQVIEYLTHAIRTEPQIMLYSFIQKIIVFDNEIEIYYNYLKGINPDDSPPEENRDIITIDGSTLLPSGAPKEYNPNCLLVTSEWFGFTFYIH